MTSGRSKKRSFAQRLSPISLVDAEGTHFESVVRMKTVLLGINGSLSPKYAPEEKKVKEASLE